MIDSHTHLGLCKPPDEELVAAAAAAGVERMLTVGVDPQSCRDAIAAAERFEGVFAAVGCHPNAAGELDEALLRELAAHPRCVAVGETGLDYYRDRAPRDAQMRAFEVQLALARELGKPLVIHTRAADDDTLDVLRERAGGLRVLLHCFSMAARVEECIEDGYWFSFAGNVTYPGSAALAAAAAVVPADRLLVETDAPYLTPQSRRGTPNQPAYVIETAAFVAATRRIELEELDATISRNGAALFGW